MNHMSLTRKILLGIISSPLFVICAAFSLLCISLLWFVVPIILLVVLIDLIKEEYDAWSNFWGFLKMWCFIGLQLYFEMIWDYELFDDI